MKSDFIGISNPCDKMFQESNTLPPKRGEQENVKLQQHASLLSSDVNKMPVQVSAKVKEKVPKQFDKEDIGFKVSSCEFHNALSLKWDVAWR